MNLISIRGAITVDSNSRDEILLRTRELLEEIELRNNLDRQRVINITFTATRDLDQAYPAVAARQLGYSNAALMCFQEMYVVNSLEACIRVNILYLTGNSQDYARHIYLRKARFLRPDLGGSMEKLVIAVDGPASAGKSTVARRLAEELNIAYVDTGAMYRAVTYKMDRLDIDIDNKEQVNKLLENTTIDFVDGSILLDGRPVDKEIRENYISQKVSNVAKLGQVRRKLVDIQRELSRNKSMVMDGRDIGSVVLPDADFKFFVTASVKERARRRYEELLGKGQEDISLSQIEAEIARRDEIDTTRELSPLVQSPDAIKIDNSDLTKEESLAMIIGIIRRGKDVI